MLSTSRYKNNNALSDWLWVEADTLRSWASMDKNASTSATPISRGVTHTTVLLHTPSDEKKNLIEVILLCFEAIVLIPNLLAHLIKQAGGLQGRSTGFYGQFIPV